MKRWKVWACIGALFASGFLIGSAGTALYIKHAVGKFLTGGPPEVRKAVMRRLTRKLRLTAEQRPRVEEVVRATQGRLIEIRRKNEPLVDGIVREGAEEMKLFLDPGQRAKLDELLKRARAHLLLPPQEAG